MAGEEQKTSGDANSRKRLASEKVLQVERWLEERAPTAESGLFLSTNEIARDLLRKAPVEFLEKNTLDKLVHISTSARAAFDELVADPSKVVIHIETSENASRFYITLSDCPFIVNTISEAVTSSGFRTHALLHPIITHEGYLISLTYLEVEPLSEEQQEVFKKKLIRSLNDLGLVTTDFTSMLVRVETLAKVLEKKTASARFTSSERQEVSDFLRWLTDGGLVFCGYAAWDVTEDEEIGDMPSASLGILRSPETYVKQLTRETREDSQRVLQSEQLVIVNKCNTESTVHRFVRLTNFVILETDPSGRPSRVHAVTGILTSKAIAQESSSVPLIRQKLKRILQLEDVLENSHDYKSIIDMIDHMPKTEALRLEVDELQELVHIIFSIQNKNDTKVSIKIDKSRRGASILVIMPGGSFSSEVRARLQDRIETFFGATPGSVEYELDLTNKPLMKLYFYVPLSTGDKFPLNFEKLESGLVADSRTWFNNLEERILNSDKFEDPQFTWHRYENAFPSDYRALQSDEESLRDVITIETLSESHPIAVDFAYTNQESYELFTLIVYGLGKRATISQALPILENAGLEVIDERSSIVRPKGSDVIHVDRFLVKPIDVDVLKEETLRTLVAPGLTEVFVDAAVSDPLNALMLRANLNTRQIALLRSYLSLLWQVNKYASRSVLTNALASTPEAAKKLWEMFEVLFDPQRKDTIKDRELKFYKVRSEFMDVLRSVSDITQDRTLRALSDLVRFTVRTNFYQGDTVIAHKIHSEKVDILPRPRPMFEIFVHAPHMEGIHLRTDMIARGGLRWSDRHEDYRSEILGLVKTQKIKNSLIVPQGAKGGFVVNHLPKEHGAMKVAVESAYKDFIRALLSVTDNRKNGTVVTPDKVIAFDEEDPYLVVAADKGTATFSDIANKIAVEEYDFWLNDAFASGGTNGYDHKKYGITARGAWECVKRHFVDLGIDYVNKPFTATGIGDMSGDVFGNGLLLSKKYKLIAAFNHKHIFIDPDPDPDISFLERKRLFETPGSQWTDYSPELISEGGAVINRFEKEIELSPAFRSALSISDDAKNVVTGEELIAHIMRAKVDLLWNGGIGTYVKSSNESHADVADGTNDRVRIDANELRARIVGEGGNLGLTQEARIEFASRGGKINTDAIDNSGGVDLSDHEVNLKILFAELMRKNQLSLEDRNKLLDDLAEPVIDDVLEHNTNHALVLTIGAKRSKINIQYFASLIGDISNRAYIDRNLEFLPDDQELAERTAKKEGLERPELAVCVSAVKLWVKDTLLHSPLLDDPLLERFLFEYFPEKIRDKYASEIKNHPLAKHIIATQISNSLVDSFGITFVHRMRISHTVRSVDVVKCALAADEILGLHEIRRKVKAFDTFSTNKLYLQLRLELNRTLRDATSWIMGHHAQTERLGKIVERYKNDYRTLLENMEDTLLGEDRLDYVEKLEKYREHKLDEFSARSLAGFWRMEQVFEMLRASKQSGEDIKSVAHVYAKVMETLRINAVLQAAEHMIPSNKWENELLSSSREEGRRGLTRITCKLLEEDCTEEHAIARRVLSSDSYEQYRDTLEEVTTKLEGVASFSILAKQIRRFKI